MTRETFTDLVPARNEMVHRKHRREVFWQITFPLALGTLLILTICGLTIAAAVAGDALVGLWRDISLIWVLTPAILLSVIPLALFAVTAYGVVRLIQVLPGFFFKIQAFLANVAARVHGLSDRVSSPFIRVNSLWAGLRRLWGKR